MVNQNERPQLAVNLVLFTAVPAQALETLDTVGMIHGLAHTKKTSDNGMTLAIVTQMEDGRVLPGGFVEGNEQIAQAAERIAIEKLGVREFGRLREVGTFDKPNRNPGQRVISFPFYGFIHFEDLRGSLGGREQIGLEVVNSEAWLDQHASELDEFDGYCRFGGRLNPTESRGHEKVLSERANGSRILALDHDELVFYAWRRLRYAFNGKLDPFRYLGVAVLGEQFRLSQLQVLNDLIRGEASKRDAFRRQILNRSNFLSETGRMDGSLPGKPAALFTSNVKIAPRVKFDPLDPDKN